MNKIRIFTFFMVWTWLAIIVFEVIDSNLIAVMTLLLSLVIIGMCFCVKNCYRQDDHVQGPGPAFFAPNEDTQVLRNQG